MKLRYQRFLYLSFFAIFFISAPLLVLYTAGYRYDFVRHSIIKTGSLVVESEPSSAQIYLNNELLGETPLRPTKVLPGTYDLRIEKETYHPIKKIIDVRSNLTTFVTTATLFKDAAPTPLITAPLQLVSFSPNGQYIIYATSSAENVTLGIYTKATTGFKTLRHWSQKNVGTLSALDWSTDGDMLIIKQTIGSFNSYLLIDPVQQKITDLLDITRLNFEEVHWHQRANQILLGLRKKSLYQIDLVAQAITPITTDAITSFASYRNGLIFTTTGEEGSILHFKTFENNLSPEDKKIKLPVVSRYTLDVSNPAIIVIIDAPHDQTYLVQPNIFEQADPATALLWQTTADHVAWSDDKQRLATWTDVELSVYDVLSNTSQLITRFGAPLQSVSWYPIGQQLIYVVDNTLHAIETTPTPLKTDTLLTTLDQYKQLNINPRGNNLLIFGTHNKQAGVFQLEMQ